MKRRELEGEIVLSASTEPDELTDLRRALADALRLPTGDTPPEPDVDWRSSWDRIADLGVLGLCVPEEAGGFGTRVDAAVVAARTLGAALHPAPFAEMAAAAVALAGGPEPARSLLDDVLTGKVTCGFVHYDPLTRVARSVLDDDEHATYVLAHPDGSLALAREIYCDVRSSVHSGFDETRSVVDLHVDLRESIALPSSTLVQPLYRLLLAADALGAVERSLDRCITYARTREAFGKPLGGFQAVQHRLVDHTLRVRGMSLAVTAAAAALTRADADAERRVLVAEVAVARHAVHVLHDLLQLTGGIGFTWEHGLHLFERRAQLDASLAGNPRRALADLARFEGWSA